jgi:hypothetical protein
MICFPGVGEKQKAPRTRRSAAPVKLRETTSPWHVADPSLTDKDGKQDAKEDDDEKDELHLVPVLVWGLPDVYSPDWILRLRDF